MSKLSPEATPQQEFARLRPRQRLLLAFFAALGGRIGRTDFQKLLFLYCQEMDKGRPYQFVPYQYGAFSFNSYADCRKLIDRGFLVEEEGSGVETHDPWPRDCGLPPGCKH